MLDTKKTRKFHEPIAHAKLLGTETDDCVKEKAVSTTEVNKYLALGWEYVTNLPDKKVIIRLKT